TDARVAARPAALYGVAVDEAGRVPAGPSRSVGAAPRRHRPHPRDGLRPRPIRNPGAHHVDHRPQPPHGPRAPRRGRAGRGPAPHLTLATVPAIARSETRARTMSLTVRSPRTDPAVPAGAAQAEAPAGPPGSGGPAHRDEARRASAPGRATPRRRSPQRRRRT